jgi:hypothetical protein
VRDQPARTARKLGIRYGCSGRQCLIVNFHIEERAGLAALGCEVRFYFMKCLSGQIVRRPRWSMEGSMLGVRGGKVDSETRPPTGFDEVKRLSGIA